jgi:hypothetical protein
VLSVLGSLDGIRTPGIVWFHKTLVTGKNRVISGDR